MNESSVLETFARDGKWNTPAEACAAFKAHGVAGEFILSVLLKRSVIAMGPDGSVAGVLKSASHKAGPRSPDGWGESWPAKDGILGAMEAGALAFSDLRERLSELGDDAGYWALIHALRWLQQNGLVEREGRMYVRVKQAAPKPAVSFAKAWNVASEEARGHLIAAVRETVTGDGRIDPDEISSICEAELIADWGVEAFTLPFLTWVYQTHVKDQNAEAAS